MAKKNKAPFNVGDWVEFEDTTDDWGGTRTFIEKVREIDYEFRSFSSYNQMFFLDWDNIKLWTPKVGEAVFTTILGKDPVTSENKEYCVLCKVAKVIDDTTYLMNNGATANLSDIEPFNGNLPLEIDY